MTLHAVALALTFAVKNGPAGMWRGAAGSDSGGGASTLFTSTPALVVTVCVTLALAVVVFSGRRRRARRGTIAPLCLLGLLVTLEFVTRAALLGLIVPVLLTGLWIAVLWPRSWRASRSPSGQTAEVIDLARWRADRQTRRRAGSR